MISLIHTKKAASVFPEPVGAKIRVFCFLKMEGQPLSCGGVGVLNVFLNQFFSVGWNCFRMLLVVIGGMI